MDQLKTLIQDFEERASAPPQPEDTATDLSLAEAGAASTGLEMPSEERTPVLERVRAGFRMFSPTGGFSRALDDMMTPPVPVVREEEIDLDSGVLDGVPEDKKHLVMGQLNNEEAWKKRQELLQEKEDLESIADGGVLSTLGITILPYILDPASYVGGSGVLRATKALGAATKMSRIQKYGTAAALTGGLAVSEEAASMYGRDMRDADDLLYAAAIGGVAGPVVSKFTRAFDTDVVEHISKQTDASKTTALEMLDEAIPKHMTDPPVDVNQVYSIDDITGRDIAARMLDDPEYAQSTKEFLKQNKITGLAENVSTEKAAIALRTEELVKAGKVTDIQDVGKIGRVMKFNPLQTDALRLLGSKAPAVRVFATHLLENASGIGGRIVNRTASMIKRVEETRLLRAIPDYNNSFANWADARKIPRLKRLTQKQQFNRELRLEMEHRHLTGNTLSLDPDIKRAADAFDNSTRQALTLLKKAGVTGADQVTFKYGHVPLVLDSNAIGKLIRETGSSADLEELFSLAYRNAGLKPKVAQRVAKAQIQRSVRGQTRTDAHPDTLFSRDKRGDLEVLLEEAQVSKEDIKGILKQLDEMEDSATGSMRQRVAIDLNASIGDRALIDFVNNDIGNLMSRMYQESAGRAALGFKGMKNLDDVRDMIDVGLAQAAAAGEDVKKLRGSLEGVVDEMLARPVAGGVSPAVRRFMDYTLVSRLAGIGFAQAAELQNLAGEHGLLATLRAIPRMAKARNSLRNAAKTSDYSKVDPLFQEIRVWGGDLWQEELLYRPGVILDESPLSSGGWKIADDMMAKAKDKLGTWSGLYGIRAIQNLAVTQLMTDKVVKTLTSGKLTKAKLSRLENIGISGDVLDRIKAQLGNVEIKRGSVNRLNLDKWEPLAREDFVSALHRHTGQIIQRGFVGESSFWLHKDVAALLTQFRSFPILALEKQTGRNLLQADMTTAMVAMYGSAFSLAASMAKVHMLSLGRSDRDEYILEQMEPGKLAMHAVNYGSFYSLGGDLLGTLGVGGGRAGIGDTVPTLSTIADVVNAPLQFATEGATPSSVRKAAAAMPFGSLPHMRLLANQAGNLAE